MAASMQYGTYHLFVDKVNFWLPDNWCYINETIVAQMTSVGLFSTIISFIRACACWALFVVTLTNTVHLICIYIHIYAHCENQREHDIHCKVALPSLKYSMLAHAWRYGLHMDRYWPELVIPSATETEYSRNREVTANRITNHGTEHAETMHSGLSLENILPNI